MGNESGTLTAHMTPNVTQMKDFWTDDFHQPFVMYSLPTGSTYGAFENHGPMIALLKGMCFILTESMLYNSERQKRCVKNGLLLYFTISSIRCR